MRHVHSLLVSMQSHEDDIYRPLRAWIKSARIHNRPWEEIRAKASDSIFIKNHINDDFWPEDSKEVWIDIVDGVKKVEDDTKEIRERTKGGTLRGPNQKNDLTVPEDNDSCWIQYVNKLEKKGYKNILDIQEECLNILHNISNDTKDIDPVKGLVVGNVQSGKTANMAGLISMAADYGWNFFIILSGTINSLRVQTRDRMYSDLDSGNSGKYTWSTFDHLNLKSPDAKPEKLYLSPNSYVRYLSVCLKNKKRLSDLLKWINRDLNKKAQMKILLIDDEADQASINTTYPDEERNMINGLIVKLVEGQDEHGIKSPYGAMNYVAYTATPYANFLSEGSPESLYPRDFISLLTPSNLYLGPGEMFGHEDLNLSGMSIVNCYENCDDAMDMLYNEKLSEVPDGLKDAICWFICCAAVLRKQGFGRPVSMLVHTTSLTDYHKLVAEYIQEYMLSGRSDIKSRCRSVYETQTERFSMSVFYEQVPNYDLPSSYICDYPPYSEIVGLIDELIKIEPNHIRMDEDRSIIYHEGIHLCIDNSKKMIIDDDENSLPRLIYPEGKDLGTETCPSKTPAFIVVGGNTMSRGLTIEGLVSTYFARDVSQADTLMQMGRWFGYRRRYELLPRIWMSEDSKRSFETLVDLDYSLRHFIRENYEVVTPEIFPPLVKRFPQTSQLKRITASSKMRGAVEAGYLFEGTMVETTSFDREISGLKSNIESAENFIKSLNRLPVKSQTTEGLVWRGVPSDAIFSDFLETFTFSKKQKNFSALTEMKKWISEKSDNEWNVVLAGIKNGKHGTWNICDGASVNIVERSSKEEGGDSAYIGSSLSSPSDRTADIELGSLNSAEMKKFQDLAINHSKNWRRIRADFGLSDIPMLLIYRISKDSKPASANKYLLGVDEDIIGISVIMPGLTKAKLEAEYLQLPSAAVRRTE